MSAIKTTRRYLRPIRRFAEAARMRIVELPYLLRRPDLGTRNWLIQREVRYGGYTTMVPRQRVSPFDGRTKEQLAFGGMTGGDRMLHHGYAPTYSRYLLPFLDHAAPGAANITIAEFGILKGTGLAIWCDLFTSARVIAFDIDLSHFESNRAVLEHRGAFTRNKPELHEYDQLVCGEDRLREVLAGGTLDIVIDDGLHSIESIITTWRSAKPHLSSRFVYIIEDYADLLDTIGSEFEGYDQKAYGMLTVISRGVPSN